MNLEKRRQEVVISRSKLASKSGVGLPIVNSALTDVNYTVIRNARKIANVLGLEIIIIEIASVEDVREQIEAETKAQRIINSVRNMDVPDEVLVSRIARAIRTF